MQNQKNTIRELYQKRLYREALYQKLIAQGLSEKQAKLLLARNAKFLDNIN